MLRRGRQAVTGEIAHIVLIVRQSGTREQLNVLLGQAVALCLLVFARVQVELLHVPLESVLYFNVCIICGSGHGRRGMQRVGV